MATCAACAKYWEVLTSKEIACLALSTVQPSHIIQRYKTLYSKLDGVPLPPVTVSKHALEQYAQFTTSLPTHRARHHHPMHLLSAYITAWSRRHVIGRTTPPGEPTAALRTFVVRGGITRIDCPPLLVDWSRVMPGR